MRLLLGLLVLAPLASASVPRPSLPRSADSERTPVTLADLARVHRIVAVDVAADGSRAVYAVRSVHLEGTEPGDEAGYRTHLWTVALDGEEARPVQLTFGERADGDPRISPDGRWLAFARRGADDDAADDDGPRGQVWLLPLDGPGEARQLTELEHGARAPRWRPDGGALLVTTSVPVAEVAGAPPWPHERPARGWRDFAPAPRGAVGDGGDGADAGPGERAPELPADLDGDADALRRWLDARAAERDPDVIVRLAFQGEQGLRGPDRVARLVLLELEPAAGGGLAVAAERALGSGFDDRRDAAWAPDGRRLAFVAAPPVAEHRDRVHRSAVWLLDVPADPAAEVPAPRPVLDDAAHTFADPTWTADGAHLFVRRRATDEPLFRPWELCRVGADGAGLERWTAELDASVGALHPVGDDVCFEVGLLGVSFLFRTRGGPDRAEALYMGPGMLGALDVTPDGRAVAAISTAENPHELGLVGLDGGVRPLTDLHAELLAERAVSTPCVHELERDGFRVQYWVMEPTGRVEGERYPCVLAIHGGPHVMWGPGSHTMWHEWQVQCGRGYGVVFANPRGSAGYGWAHRRGNFQDWGAGPAGDVLAALDAAVAEHDWIDPERLVVTGGSYAGYLTAWIVAHDDRFRAAVAQRGVYDLATFFGEGNAWRLVELAFGGFPWEPETRAVLERESPFTHVAGIETPLLVVHASRDLRTGVSQSEMLYRALKELRRPVEYVRYPATGHDLSRTGDPLQRMDRLGRIVEFFERWIGEPRPAGAQ